MTHSLSYLVLFIPSAAVGAALVIAAAFQHFRREW
jgi:hypothetical protein